MSTDPTAEAAWLRNVEDLQNPLVVMNRFYQQIVEIKRLIDSGRLPEDVSQQLRLGRAPNEQEMAEAVSLRLQRWIEQLRLRIRRKLTEREAERVEEALYVVAALADELFIMELDWPARDAWESVLLEDRLFRSSYAGERFFERARELLQARTLDPQQQQLAAVYLMALRLGFAGRHRGDDEILARYRQRLFRRIAVTQGEGQQPLYAQAYANVLASLEEQRLAPLGNWYRFTALGLLAHLALSWLVWISTTGYWT